MDESNRSVEKATGKEKHEEGECEKDQQQYKEMSKDEVIRVQKFLIKKLIKKLEEEK